LSLASVATVFAVSVLHAVAGPEDSAGCSVELEISVDDSATGAASVFSSAAAGFAVTVASDALASSSFGAADGATLFATYLCTENPESDQNGTVT